VANSDLEAICRMVSLWLRVGGSLRHVIKQLEGIGSSLQIPTRTGHIMSLGDGLACALKKYTRAKERFGLRALLLGEIDPAEIDNPRPAPHTPQTTPIDRPLPPTGGPTQSAAKAAAPGAQRRLEGPAARPAQRSAPPQAFKSQPPKAVYATHSGGNGNGNGHDEEDAFGGPVEVAVAIAEIDEVVTADDVLAADSETALVEAVDEVETAARAARSAVAELSRALSGVRSAHDVASHYKVRCPECGQALVLQEGCRKCLNCGWAAC